MSFVETCSNIIVGFAVATAANFWVLPLFGFHSTMRNSVEISVIYTAISLVRSYSMRRLFNSLQSEIEFRHSSGSAFCLRKDGTISHDL